MAASNAWRCSGKREVDARHAPVKASADVADPHVTRCEHDALAPTSMEPYTESRTPPSNRGSTHPIATSNAPVIRLYPASDGGANIRSSSVIMRSTKNFLYDASRSMHRSASGFVSPL